MFPVNPSISPTQGQFLMTLLASLSWQVLGNIGVSALDAIVISGVTVDSRKVEKGSLFIALTGSKADGHDFVDQVIKGGLAAAVIIEKGRLSEKHLSVHAAGAPVILEVADSHLAYARIADHLYRRPAQGLTLVGITGTNGKTTVSYLLETLLQKQGVAVGVIGTVNYRYCDSQGQSFVFPAPFTTPEPLLLQGLLRQMADAGVSIVIMEVSSHALSQHRLGDLQFAVVAFTNFSRDHLDYHKDMAEYFAAKSLLFADHLQQGGTAVITRLSEYDAEEEQRVARLIALVEAQGGHIWQCGRSPRETSCGRPGSPPGGAPTGSLSGVQVGKSDLYPLQIQSGRDATVIFLQVGEEEVQISSPLVGEFNVANVQTAMGIARALGIEASVVASMLGEAVGAPGRLQRIRPATGELSWRPTVFVDYAHTPDALEKVLATLAQLPHGRLICVFGCGGDRDTGKRAIMGEIAGRRCDRVIVTDDNPRSEDPATIVSQIVSGVRASSLVEQTVAGLAHGEAVDNDGKGFMVLHDRAEAIRRAIAAARADDIVLIAGKGHEQYQHGRDGKRFFDDCLEVQKELTVWTLDALRLATRGVVSGKTGGKVELGAIVTDSRKMNKGDIFVALSGERFDGHDFLEQAVAAGAAVLVLSKSSAVEQIQALSDIPLLLVEDTLQALGDLAAYRRQVMKEVASPLVVGITGSCGKTTVKEMTAAIFAKHWPSGAKDATMAPESQVLKTQGNYNNLIGMPLSLLPVSPAHKALILEMGMNQSGEIDRLARIAAPDIACIVNVHAAHLEGLHSIEGVAKAKEELFAGCGQNAVLIVNLDDPLVRTMAQKYQRKKIFYALDTPEKNGERVELPQVWASGSIKAENGSQHFILHVGKQTRPVTLCVQGVHNVANAVAAAAIAHAAGIGIAEINDGLAAFRSADKRMQIVKGKGGLLILNDTYNANPASMRAGIVTLAQQEGKRRVAILGDMLELGPGSGEAHRDIGLFLAGQGVDFVALVGSFAPETAAGALQAGMKKRQLLVFSEKQEVVPWIEGLLATGQLQAGDWLLVKGSRGMRLEEVVERLVPGELSDELSDKNLTPEID